MSTQRESQCGDKVPYTTLDVAAHAAEALAWAGAGVMQPYECPWCGFCHVGHEAMDRERPPLPPKKAPHRTKKTPHPKSRRRR